MSFLSELTDPGIAPITGAVITGLISLQTLFLKWLINSFAELRKDLKSSTVETQQWLINHEGKDSDRHLENLRRFETISVALAKIGKI